MLLYPIINNFKYKLLSLGKVGNLSALIKFRHFVFDTSQHYGNKTKMFKLNWRKKQEQEQNSQKQDQNDTLSHSINVPSRYHPKHDSPDSKEHRLRLIFNMFDSNNDGKLTAEEVKDFLSSVYDKSYIESLSKQWKFDSKGLTFQDFLEICAHDSAEEDSGNGATSFLRNTLWKFKPFNIIMKKRDSSSTTSTFSNEEFDETELKKAFHEIFDANRDGVLTKTEFRKVLKNLRIGEAFEDDEIDQLFDSVAQSSDFIKFEQFAELLKDI